MHIRIDVRTRNGFLEQFYDQINPEHGLGRFHVPHSDVFYVQEALYNRTGKHFSLEEVESGMLAEGWCPD